VISPWFVVNLMVVVLILFLSAAWVAVENRRAQAIVTFVN